MRRRALIAAVLAVAILGVAIAAALATSTSPPPSAVVKIRGLTDRATFGKYCPPDHACTDELAYPRRLKGHLPAPANARVLIDLDRRASSVEVHPWRAHGELIGPQIAAEKVDEGHRWRLRLPDDVRGATRLWILVEYAGGGNAYFWAGIREVASWPRAAGGPAGRRAAFVAAHGLSARATLGTHCLPSNGATMCADYMYPLDPRGHLPAEPGARMRVKLRRRATSVTASLVRQDGDDFEFVSSSFAATRAENSKRWRLRLPDDLHGANRLSLDVDYVDGDANYWAGLRRVERWP